MGRAPRRRFPQGHLDSCTTDRYSAWKHYLRSPHTRYAQLNRTPLPNPSLGMSVSRCRLGAVMRDAVHDAPLPQYLLAPLLSAIDSAHHLSSSHRASSLASSTPSRSEHLPAPTDSPTFYPHACRSLRTPSAHSPSKAAPYATRLQMPRHNSHQAGVGPSSVPPSVTLRRFHRRRPLPLPTFQRRSRATPCPGL